MLKALLLSMNRNSKIINYLVNFFYETSKYHHKRGKGLEGNRNEKGRSQVKVMKDPQREEKK